ncbi:MAG TPA: hypothetical protein VHE60_16460 [Pyrinomonadaceae bacterium]|nr:hypothetical protein [Pyrinomonadaceae bacterium]
MLGHKSILPRFVSYLILVLFFLVLSVSVDGQTANGSAVATNTAAVKEEPARSPDAQSPSIDSNGSRANASGDSVLREEKATNSKGDAPKAIPAALPPVAPCQRTINANVVALPQPIMLNRMGAAIPDGLVFALKSDTAVVNGWLQLRPGKRPRPLVLRANVGDCLNITFTNSVPKNNFTITKAAPPTGTTELSLHIQGMEWTTSTMDDGSFVGVNPSSLVNAPNPPPPPQQYKLFVKNEGTFLLYTMGDTSSEGGQLARGLFGALNVQPEGAEWYRSEVTQQDLKLVTKSISPDGHPVVDYSAVYAPGSTWPDGTPIPTNTPILNMLDANNSIVHTDLTAIITGPKAGRFPGTTGVNKPETTCNAEKLAALNPPPGGKVDPIFCTNPAAPDRKQPYREFTIIYHEVGAVASQAFPVFNDLSDTLAPGADGFAINYGTGGIGSEVYANRIGVGPMGNCVDCKFEEFFLSAWSVGDPAMLVDKPANSNNLTQNANFQPPCNTTAAFNQPPCGGTRVPASPAAPYTMQPTAKATVAFFPDDPSNVYHSYINDHVKFRILHGGTGVTHVHHQHAHQWLQSPNSDEGSYLDSQMISPGASYTLEMTYNGSGNRNKVVGDSIFHCHFYPHFAAGMWAMWRTHDVFESGTELAKSGIPLKGARALPDGEIMAGTPIPAIVPLPTIPMAPLPSAVFIDNGQVVYGTPGPGADPTGALVTANPGFPFFIPGRAGARAPHPPLDFAPDTVNGGLLDGGLPRHLVTGGSISYERHNKFDWSKDLATINAIQLPELGTPVEQVAMKFFGKRCYATFFPDGTPGSCPSSNSTPPQSTLNTPPTGFILNGLPLGPQHGAPFADPAVDDNGNPVGLKRTYKAAAIQLNVTFNKKGWHFPQQRILTLWDDVRPTLAYTPGGSTGRAPEPLFFRGNSGDVIEYWHTNLVPNYYLVDDFQVRTPTDVIGQHIHLVKFDVTSSDGAGNGFNYEDGTFSPQEVQEVIKGINAAGGLVTSGQPPQMLTPKLPPSEIIDCASNPGDPRCTPCPDNWTVNSRPQCPSWMGAQTTIQRWYLDPLVDDSGVDRTLRTVFTHDHFGPSTHQQAGLYAGLVVEPQGSTWTSNDGSATFGSRPDGGPTSWQARILTNTAADSYREFMLEFQDFQLAYATASASSVTPPITQPNPNPNKGWSDPAYAINGRSPAQLISTGVKPPPGTQSVNYLNEPIAWRVGKFGDMSYVYDSSFKQASNLPPNGDPITPLLRAYQGDKVQVRILVGAHMFAHQFNLEGPRWFAEPSWKNSGYRSVQAMGLSEHFEFLFNVPSSSAPNVSRKCPDKMSDGNCADYLYSPSLDDTGVANGMWGIFRAYDPTKTADKLQPLPNNPVGPSANVAYSTCPANLAPPAVKRVFNITAVTAQKALSSISPVPGLNPPQGQILFNTRGQTLRSKIGVMYVRSEDLDAQGKLKAGTPVEPLILRANAGDCIEVNLTNALAASSLVYQQNFSLASPFNGVNPANHQPVFQSQMSKYVGLHPQLLSYDAAVSDGINVGWNSEMKNQVAPFGQTIKYQWYAGRIDRNNTGNLTYTPVEFGSVNLFPSDPVYQHINGLFGSMIIEPQGSTWKCGEAGSLADCDPPSAAPTSRASATVTLPDNTTFREFALMISDDFRISQGNSSAVNYRTEPKSFRYAGNSTTDFSCMLSNQLIQTAQKDPKTPILTAEVGDAVRFRMTHPFGTGTSQVFTLHGHVWQRNPYTNESTVIGNNSLSQWLGSRDNHGATDHFELVVNKAGGEAGQAGDYLYTVFLPNQATLGAWGIFRVGHNSGPAPPVTECKPPVQPKALPVVPKKDDLKRFIREPVKDTSKP